MTIKSFIEKAIEGGYETWYFHTNEWTRGHLVAGIFLDPEAWKAVGKALGNKDEMRCTSEKCDTVQCEYAGYWDWKRKMVGLMEAIVYSDMTIEQYLETLGGEEKVVDEPRCLTSPHCSHNKNGRDLDKPCSVAFGVDEGV